MLQEASNLYSGLIAYQKELIYGVITAFASPVIFVETMYRLKKLS
jgi:hypothetical protein